MSIINGAVLLPIVLAVALLVAERIHTSADLED